MDSSVPPLVDGLFRGCTFPSRGGWWVPVGRWKRLGDILQNLKHLFDFNGAFKETVVELYDSITFNRISLSLSVPRCVKGLKYKIV